MAGADADSLAYLQILTGNTANQAKPCLKARQPVSLVVDDVQVLLLLALLALRRRWEVIEGGAAVGLLVTRESALRRRLYWAHTR